MIAQVGRAQVVEALVRTAVVLAAFLVVWWLLSRFGRRGMARMVARSGDPHGRARAETLWSVLRRLAVLVLLAVLALTVADVWSIPIAPFVAVGSVVGVAIGFGAQDLVKDMISGFFILAEDQFHIGDVVSIAGVTGEVEDIRLRVTVLRDQDGYVHYVPNGEIKVTSNLTHEFAQVVLDVPVAYHEDVDRALRVVEDELARFASDWSARMVEPPVVLGVEQLADSGVLIRSLLKTVPDDRWPVRREGLRRLKNRLDAEGIEIPFRHLSGFFPDNGRPVNLG